MRTDEILLDLEKKGIGVIIGSYILYKNGFIDYKDVSDIDFIIQFEDKVKVLILLKNEGYMVSDCKEIYCIKKNKKPIHVVINYYEKEMIYNNIEMVVEAKRKRGSKNDKKQLKSYDRITRKTN